MRKKLAQQKVEQISPIASRRSPLRKYSVVALRESEKIKRQTS